MKRRFPVPADTLRSQADASDPDTSAWVSANAGSGKTHVLAQRVIRLLLDGTDPSKILCLTYTRAAAANMANRVFETLGAWCLLPDDGLTEEILRIEGRPPGAARLRRARRLFARALETPGGLKIQTIHAFCEAILHQFPLEANIAGHFELLDPQMEEALLGEARRDLLSGVATEADGALAEAFAEVLERGGESGLEALLSEIVTQRDGLRRLIDEIGNDPAPYRALFELFGFDERENAEAIAQSVWPLAGFSPPEFQHLVAVAQAVDARQVQKYILPCAQAAFAQNDPVERLCLLRNGFLTDKGQPYGTNVFKKALCDRLPGIYERYVDCAEIIKDAADRLALYRMLEATRAALTIADWLIARYERLKRARGFLDFNDLIERTIRLLARPDAGPWVHYKLDKGIDHILIDEAQDTSPDQWKIVKLLVAEFFAGAGARDDVRRTIFAVGDEKQSIYSFQGAEPAAFADHGTLFSHRARAAGGRFEEVRLRHSFRSTDDVLSAVDLVFARKDVQAGLTRDPEVIDHKAIRAGAPGYVELWSPLKQEQVDEPEDWTRAIDHASAPAARLAETIADTIHGWLESGERMEGTGERLSPGDVMVLVRKRDRFVHALSRSLKNRDVDVAGADRLRLTAHIAVQDLVALGRFLAQPHDDLSLAAVLKSPLFDFDDERLFALAFDRGDATSLFEALRRKAQADETLAAVAERLVELQNAAAFRPVFEFYAGILAGTAGHEGARRRFVARLGHEANDVLDEFLSFCLACERSGLTDLEAFLASLDGAAPEIKREMDQRRDEVRILTVHAAKGLEAPVVFLVDPGSAAFHDQHLPRLMPFEPANGEWRSKGYLWRAGKEVSNDAVRVYEAEARRKAEEEYRRLLYVGMTRAEDRLIVCGYHGLRMPPGPTWHQIIESALAGAPETETRDAPEAVAPVYRYRVNAVRATPPEETETERVPVVLPLPPELTTAPPPAPAMPRPLSPSGASAFVEAGHEPTVSPRSPVLDADAAPAFAIERGRAVHRLLQMLPDVAVERREAVAMRYLGRIGAEWPQAERDAIWRSVAGILDDARFAPLFAPGSRAEVSVMGTIDLGGGRRAISGKIDRLAVTGDAVQIVDYKTNRPPPESLAAVPEGYVAQLALYAQLLKPLYPARHVSAALLFTEAPRLIAVPGEALEAVLARLGRV